MEVCALRGHGVRVPCGAKPQSSVTCPDALLFLFPNLLTFALKNQRGVTSELSYAQAQGESLHDSPLQHTLRLAKVRSSDAADA